MAEVLRGSGLYNASIVGRAVMFPILPGAALRFAPSRCLNPLACLVDGGASRLQPQGERRSIGTSRGFLVPDWWAGAYPQRYVFSKVHHPHSDDVRFH